METDEDKDEVDKAPSAHTPKQGARSEPGDKSDANKGARTWSDVCFGVQDLFV